MYDRKKIRSAQNVTDVSFFVVLVQIRKGFFQVLREHGLVFGFDYYIIHVSFHISMGLGLKTNLDRSCQG